MNHEIETYTDTETFSWPYFFAKTYDQTNKQDITEALYFGNHLVDEIRNNHPEHLELAKNFISNLNSMRHEHRAILYYQERNDPRMMDEAITEFNAFRHNAKQYFIEILKHLHQK